MRTLKPCYQYFHSFVYHTLAIFVLQVFLFFWFAITRLAHTWLNPSWWHFKLDGGNFHIYRPHAIGVFLGRVASWGFMEQNMQQGGRSRRKESRSRSMSKNPLMWSEEFLWSVFHWKSLHNRQNFVMNGDQYSNSTNFVNLQIWVHIWPNTFA